MVVAGCDAVDKNIDFIRAIAPPPDVAAAVVAPEVASLAPLAVLEEPIFLPAVIPEPPIEDEEEEDDDNSVVVIFGSPAKRKGVVS